MWEEGSKLANTDTNTVQTSLGLITESIYGAASRTLGNFKLSYLEPSNSHPHKGKKKVKPH